MRGLEKAIQIIGLTSLLSLEACAAAPANPTPESPNNKVPSNSSRTLKNSDYGVDNNYGDDGNIRISRANDQTFVITRRFRLSGDSVLGLGLGMEWLREHGCTIKNLPDNPRSESAGLLIVNVEPSPNCAPQIK